MSRLRLGQRDVRALLAGAGAVATILLAVRGVPLYFAWTQEARAEDTEARTAAARERALVADAGAANDSAVVRGRRMIALAPAVLSGDTPNSASATLAGLLSGAAAQSGVRLSSVQMHGDSLSHDVFTRIAAHLEATGDIRGITQLLAVLERGPTLLAITSLAITQPDPNAGDDRIEALRLELDVQGLMLNPKSAK